MKPSLADLGASRREWIETVLKPWCRTASRAELMKAELDWIDLAGNVDPKATLWTWAWGRFPALVHEGLVGVDETNEVRVTLATGDHYDGYPDNRRSHRGELVLVSSGGSKVARPTPHALSIDEIVSVERCAPH